MEYSNTGGMRSPFSPRVRQTITGRKPIGISARKNQGKFGQPQDSQGGDVIYKTPTCTIETYGAPLPVLVTETLTFAPGSVSVRLSPCGWCWVVAGRRVAAWHRDGSGGAARELTLPQTDLAHKADLVEIFYEDDKAQMPSCVGVSPEGVVRYWWSIGHESASTDVSCELAGQECDRLLATRGYLLLATTTCCVLLLQPQRHDGRATVTCRVLRPPSGWLGVLGRRVSLMLFSEPHADTKLVGMAVVSEGPLDASCEAGGAGAGVGEGAAGGGEAAGAEGGCVVVVGHGGAGAGPLMQVWGRAGLHAHSLRRPLADAYGEWSNTEVTALDVRSRGDKSVLLLLAADQRHAVAHISLKDPARPVVVSVMAWRGAAGGGAPRFLPLDGRLLLYTPCWLALVTGAGAVDKVEVVDVGSERDRVLGAELCGAAPLLFSAKHGVLALSAPPHQPRRARALSVCDSPLGSPCPSDMYDGNLSFYEIDPHEVSAVSQDACGQLKAAFLFHVGRDEAAAAATLRRLFPEAASALPAVDNVLDATVVAAAAELIDDPPAGDPRWKARGGGLRTRVPLGSSTALQAAQQLRDKQRALAMFRTFLAAHRLLQRLQRVTPERGGGSVSTVSVLCALSEKLAVAATLRRLQDDKHSQLITRAISQVICGEDKMQEEEREVVEALCSGALCPSDVFYRRASRVWRVLRALRPDPPVAQDALDVLDQCLTEAYKSRAQWGTEEELELPTAYEVLPDLLQIVKQALSEPGEAAGRWRVCEAAARLAGSLAAALAARAPAQPLRRMRTDLVNAFVDEGMVERAAVLAEKFKDYELLVDMFVAQNDLERLYSYIDKYASEGIAEIAFARIVERGGPLVTALVRCERASVVARLGPWLAAAPQRAPLLALWRLQRGSHGAAAEVLARLADEHTASVARLTTMASLGKLCLVCSEQEGAGGAAGAEGATGAALDARLWLAAQHAALPPALRAAAPPTGPLLAPELLVQMYIDSDSRDITEYDLKKALDLTDYVEDMERRDDLRLKVWVSAVRRDEWGAGGGEARHELQRSLFFRLVQLVHVMGGDVALVLPPVEDILVSPELAEMLTERLQYLLRLAYETAPAHKDRHEHHLDADHHADHRPMSQELSSA